MARRHGRRPSASTPRGHSGGMDGQGTAGPRRLPGGDREARLRQLVPGGPDASFEGLYSGEDLGLTRDDPWPASDVHNAREAEWASGKPSAEVLARFERAHRQLVEVVGSLSEEEADDDRYTGKRRCPPGGTTPRTYRNCRRWPAIAVNDKPSRHPRGSNVGTLFPLATERCANFRRQGLRPEVEWRPPAA